MYDEVALMAQCIMIDGEDYCLSIGVDASEV
jgi:hypothetical protein